MLKGTNSLWRLNRASHTHTINQWRPKPKAVTVVAIKDKPGRYGKRGTGENDAVNGNQFKKLSHLLICIHRETSEEYTQDLYKSCNGYNKYR